MAYARGMRSVPPGVALGVALAIALPLVPSAAAERRRPVHVTYDAEHLDLDGRVLQFRPSRPIVRASLVAIGEDGAELGSGAATYDRPPGDRWWSITWTQPAGTRVMMLRLRVETDDGVATRVELIPWSVAIDHEDVTFATDSAAIAPDQRVKLDASLAKITEIVDRTTPFMKVTLYIAGHTDTVGSAAKNRTLSLARASAIGAPFRKKGLAIPVLVAGFGEEVPRVKTADDTDAPANRRADYVLAPSGGAPPFKGAYLKVKAAWKPLR
jgi:outer membrane protein OmpA-like peptidoglycan-associated protein